MYPLGSVSSGLHTCTICIWKSCLCKMHLWEPINQQVSRTHINNSFNCLAPMSTLTQQNPTYAYNLPLADDLEQHIGLAARFYIHFMLLNIGIEGSSWALVADLVMKRRGMNIQTDTMINQTYLFLGLSKPGKGLGHRGHVFHLALWQR